MSQYGRPEYWEERYTRDPEPFDWLQKYQQIKELITPHIQNESAILQVGSGNSRMSEEMFEEGYTNITNIDISQTVVKAMQEKYKERNMSLRYQTMDVKAMDFQDSTFDMIVDKATFDSIICGESSTKNINKALSEIYRLLKDNGVYIMISYGQSDYRLPYLEKSEFNWDVKCDKVNKPTISTSITIQADDKDTPNVHFIYTCKKKVEEQQENQENQ